MTKILLSIMMLTMAAVFSFADEGEQEEAPDKALLQEQVQEAAPEQVQEAAPEQVQEAAPEQVQAPALDDAQEQETVKKVTRKVTLRTGASNSLTGKVESVTPADVLTRPRSNIVIVDSAGEAVNFVVKSLAVVYDQAGRFLSLDDVHPEQEVQVDYIKKPGKVKEAASIKILK
ncbi:MAG: hypothetical protein KJ994_05925 [Candidatus Omnitrophica bacterium]|nr:hypothetical protein [Candidatus Omnitrophota bacterium]